MRSREHRQFLDVHLARGLSYCVDGVVSKDGLPAELRIAIEPLEVSRLENYDRRQPTPWKRVGRTAPDGRYRMCGLAPGEYVVEVSDGTFGSARGAGGPRYRAAGRLTIATQDVRMPVIEALAPVTATFHIQTSEETSDRSNLSLLVAIHPRYAGRPAQVTTVPSAVTAQMESAVPHSLLLWGVPPNSYVKSILLQGRASPGGILQADALGGDVDAVVVLGNDAAAIDVMTTRRDGAPYTVLIVPRLGTGPALAQDTVAGVTDAGGGFRATGLRPGDYSVIASLSGLPLLVGTSGKVWLDRSPETIARLEQLRAVGTSVSIAPGAQASLAVDPVTVR